MIEPKLSIIAAVDKGGGIGLNGKIPWHLPDDFKHFRRMTLLQPVIMGRATYESMGRPLAQRHNIVLSHNRGYSTPGVLVMYQLEHAIDFAKSLPDVREVFVIGGQEIYEAAMPMASTLYLTHVEATYSADRFFPLSAVTEQDWQMVSEHYHPLNALNSIDFTITTYKRTKQIKPC